MDRKISRQATSTSGSYTSPLRQSADAMADALIYAEIADKTLDSSCGEATELLGCPVCGHCEYRNIHKERWGVCPDHMTKWPAGFDCTSYCSEAPAVWEQNQLNLADYRTVTPTPSAFEA